MDYFASDIDGTLLVQPGDIVTPAAYNAIQSLVNTGFTIVLASARNLNDIRLVAKRFDLENYIAVALNGKQITRINGKKTETLFYKSDTNYGLTLAKSKNHAVIFQFEDGTLNYLEGSQKPGDLWYSPEKASSTIIQRNAEQFYVQMPIGSVDPMGWVSFEMNGYRWSQRAKHTKASGIRNVKLLNGNGRVFACGDDANDVSMILEADYGFVMGNAKPEIKKALRNAMVLPTVEDGGIAVAADLATFTRANEIARR